jgi:8-oxo-dGTP pyrophosphatase MutT (NUDIX family)
MDYPLKDKGRPAAVLMPLIEHTDQLTMLFTVRAKHLKHHGGQISFPGGKQELTDNNLAETALRETHEEVGIEASSINVIGSLPSYRTITGYQVAPFVGFVRADVSLAFDKNEVEEVFEVPINYLVNQQNYFTHWITRNGTRHPVYFITWKQYTIWGATAAFIHSLSQHIANTKG